MTLAEFHEELEDIEESDGLWSPDVYIRIGSHYVKVSNIEYHPETHDEEEAIIIS